ncbi:MAG: hypothetical protein AB7G12_17020 [Thermoanaerobaculia bacterium]
MSANAFAAVTRWARRGAWAGLVAALLVPLAGYLTDMGWGREVLLIAPHDPSVVTLNRSLWSAGDPVADVYGSPMSEPTRVLLFGDQKVLRPEEDPALSLLPVASAGNRPIQVRTLWWAVRLAVVGLGAATAVLLGISLYARRRAHLAAAPQRA